MADETPNVTAPVANPVDATVAAAKAAQEQLAAMEATYSPHVGKTFKHNDAEVNTTWEVREYIGIQTLEIGKRCHCYKTRQYNPDQILVVPCADFLSTRTAQ